MKKVVLGRTGLNVSRLGLGGLFVSKAGAGRAEAARAVRRAIELGVNYIDTAPTYHDSEEVLGAALKGIDAPLIISTKLGGRPEPFDPRNKDGLMASIEQSLKLLGRDTIDILMIHEPDRPGQYDWWTDWEDVNGPVLEVMLDLKKQGTIKHLGLGGTTPYELAHLVRSGKFDVVLTAFNYSLLWREAELEVFPAAREHCVGVIVGSPLQQTALARKHDAAVSDRTHWLAKPRREQFKKLYALVDETGMSLPEMALRFVISNPAVHSVLMGARSAAEVEQNVAAVNRGPLRPELLARLNRIAAKVPFRPTNEPFGLGWMLSKPDLRYRGPGRA